MALIAAGSAACGSAPATPQGKVQNAFTTLAEQKSLTLSLSLDASADQIYSTLRDEDDFTKADAQMLASLHATVEVSSPKPLGRIKAGDKGNSVGFLLSDDASAKTNLVELRAVGTKLYVRADAKGIAKLADSDSDAGDGPSATDQLNMFLSKADQLPASSAALKAALKGDWISIDPKKFEDFAKSLSTDTAQPAAPKLDAATEAKVVAAVKAALAHNATYKNLGKHGGADHVQVTVPALQLAKELRTSLAPALQQIPDFKASDLDALNDVPNKTVSADVAIKDGMVSGVSVDLLQFDDTAHTGKLPLLLALDGRAAPVAAPAGAKELTPGDLVSAFTSGAFGGDDDTASDSDFDAGSIDTSGL